MNVAGAETLPIPRLIVGLGNPGRDYEDTRHNVGSMVVDALATQLHASWVPEKRWDCLLAKFSGGWLIKPMTYMNLSGSAVSTVCRFFKLQPEEVLAIYDDVDLPLGSLRMRAQGSAGGHNGVRSLISHLGGDGFGRIKVGIGATAGRPDGERLVGHVLGRFSDDEKPLVQDAVTRAKEATLFTLSRGFAAAMNHFNRKEPTQPKAKP